MADGMIRKSVLVPVCVVLVASGIGVGLLAPTACSNNGAQRGRSGHGELPATFPVKVGGKQFRLDVAADESTRIVGLGNRESIPSDGGMIFIFPQNQRREFVMRDCMFDIDVAFLDEAARVVAIHTMGVEARKDNESDSDYEYRLKRYSSRYPSRYAVEVRGGVLEGLGVRVGDKIGFDDAGLKRRMR